MTDKGVKRPYLQALGNSAISVVGSLHHLHFKKYSFLLDCNMVQGYDCKQYGYKSFFLKF